VYAIKIYILFRLDSGEFSLPHRSDPDSNETGFQRKRDIWPNEEPAQGKVPIAVESDNHICSYVPQYNNRVIYTRLIPRMTTQVMRAIIVVVCIMRYLLIRG
jgi:hypothetical protein